MLASRVRDAVHVGVLVSKARRVDQFFEWCGDPARFTNSQQVGSVGLIKMQLCFLKSFLRTASYCKRFSRSVKIQVKLPAWPVTELGSTEPKMNVEFGTTEPSREVFHSLLLVAESRKQRARDN